MTPAHRSVAHIPRLHVLTSDEVVARPDFLSNSVALLHTIGPLGAFHLRTRALQGQAYLALAKQLLLASREAGSLLVINDRIDVALAAGAEAVQLGSQSLQQNTVNRLAPNLQVGVSIHTPEEVDNAHDATWIMAGHVYETSTHPATPGRGPDFIRTIVQTTTVPVVAIGGIGPEHVASILRLGAVGVAVITGIWNERTPKNAALRYLSYLW